MLGQLDVVKAFVAASPGIQQVRGPHSLSLLHHARAGGAAAKPVLEYLTALGDADPPPPRAPLSPEQMALIAGAYAVEGGGVEPAVIAPGNNGQLALALAGRSRPLRHKGSLEFSPAGADNVRVVFDVRRDGVVLAVHDPDVVLRANEGGETIAGMAAGAGSSRPLRSVRSRPRRAASCGATARRCRCRTCPFRLLAALLEQPGEVVSRSELATRVWGTDTFVDATAGLNTAVAKLREALGDDADRPAYVETLPKRGYRFVATVLPDRARRRAGRRSSRGRAGGRSRARRDVAVRRGRGVAGGSRRRRSPPSWPVSPRGSPTTGGSTIGRSGWRSCCSTTRPAGPRWRRWRRRSPTPPSPA